MIDVAVAIDGEAVAVNYRTLTATFDQTTGKTAKAPVAPISIQAAVQPATGRQLLDLPEGLRTEAQYVAWSRVAVILDAQVQYGGDWYRIVYVWPRPQDGFTRFAMGRLK